MKTKPSYVLGTGLSHDGSACLLKDGKICVAIEKERITRRKHDGGSDGEAVRYCLDQEGIGIRDLDLVVQNANFGMFAAGNEFYRGKPRPFPGLDDTRIVTISHHLAHAYSAVGLAPFSDMAVLVIDGCGSSWDDCSERTGVRLPQEVPDGAAHLWFEKDSFYHFRENRLEPICKDFSPWGMASKEYPMHPPTTLHSIGGLYHAVSFYCFGDLNDVGKLMGLAPFGRGGQFDHQAFDLADGRVFVRYDWMRRFVRPSRTHADFKANFQYYADLAFWMQREVERAVIYVARERAKLCPSRNLAFTGGVALNAVANAQLAQGLGYENIFVTPAAGDNGLAVGCAFYGWGEVLKRERPRHNGSSCFGRRYGEDVVKRELELFLIPDEVAADAVGRDVVEILAAGLADDAQLAGKETAFLIGGSGVFCVRFKGGGEFEITVEAPRRPVGTLICDSRQLLNLVNGGDDPRAVLQAGGAQLQGILAARWPQQPWAKIRARLRRRLEERGAGACLPEAKRVANGAEAAARLLAAGKVIGWFQGESEFGPRALGHRSILADPGRPGLRDFINAKIKFREDFRPFAPAVLREDAARHFEFEGDAPYMLLVAKVRPEWRERLVNVVHQDGSARIQTVTPGWNQSLYELLVAYRELAGISVLLNTSFNRRGMPIVETPSQALAFFYETALDALIIGDYLLEKKS